MIQGAAIKLCTSFNKGTIAPQSSYSSMCNELRVSCAQVIVDPQEEDSQFQVSRSTSNASSCHTFSRGGIFLGSQLAAGKRALDALNATNPPVTGIVNCTNVFPNYFQNNGIEYCNVAVNDESGSNLLLYMEGASQFIERHVAIGGSILVHCQMGISRSSSIVIAYLIRYHQSTLDEAYEYVSRRRPMICPNPGFWHQLGVFERRCTQSDLLKTTEGNDFSTDWAQQSLATYQTIGHLLTNDPIESFPELKSCRHLDVSEMLFTALDIIFGRGVEEIDLEWFGTLCLALSGTGHDDAVKIVIHMLHEDGSKFLEVWCGEVHDSDVLRVEKAIVRTATKRLKENLKLI